jgi:hypothetical protein
MWPVPTVIQGDSFCHWDLTFLSRVAVANPICNRDCCCLPTSSSTSSIVWWLILSELWVAQIFGQNITLGACVRVFFERLTFKSVDFNKHCLPCMWASLYQLKAWIEQKDWAPLSKREFSSLSAHPAGLGLTSLYTHTDLVHIINHFLYVILFLWRTLTNIHREILADKMAIWNKAYLSQPL